MQYLAVEGYEPIYGIVVDDPTLKFPEPAGGAKSFSTKCPPGAPPTPQGINSDTYC